MTDDKLRHFKTSPNIFYDQNSLSYTADVKLSSNNNRLDFNTALSLSVYNNL